MKFIITVTYSDCYDIYEDVDIMSDLGSLKMFLYMYISDGGAILCNNCTLIINEHSTFERNNAEDGHGGAIAGEDGRISIHDYTLFDSNFASVGGAIHLENINLSISGNVSLENNSAAFGGALHIIDMNISFNMNANSKVLEFWGTGLRSVVVFRHNKALKVGGAIESHANNILLFAGAVVY